VSWDRWLEFLQMEGYGLYVWGSYLVLPALVLTELVRLRLRKREILGHLGWRRD
jgi:heme exporter protein D